MVASQCTWQSSQEENTQNGIFIALVSSITYANTEMKATQLIHKSKEENTQNSIFTALLSSITYVNTEMKQHN